MRMGRVGRVAIAAAVAVAGAGRVQSQGVAIPSAGSRAAAVASDTLWLTARQPEPRAAYGSYRAACDSLRAIARRTLGAWADSATWSQDREAFWYNDAVTLERFADGTRHWVGPGRRANSAMVPCLRMTYASHRSEAPGNEAIETELLRAGWAQDNRYSADGPDGTYYALTCREALVEIDAMWDGGDDTDTTYVPVPGERVRLRCVPRPPNDPRGLHGR